MTHHDVMGGHMNAHFQFTTDNLLTYEEVCAVTRLSQPTLRRYVKAGRFPQPIKPNPAGKAVRFRAADVRRWMAEL
ncbi:helix-turn-helix transcriptional regulator [Aeromonas caviae]|uniref:Helix-turn-helix domain-containing protein n=2 Tax=Aeromonadaceae TaxID=84642 RepID=A0AA42VG73_AERCA|nr:helix-turn-helix domain-containing protein [Aeromonas caviae]MCR3892537.1 helix-turn-helix domain-containing protein [Aeromonas caviae]MDH1900057.1 helix-turn-helix domain-containing protein [Aeromonas caviae]